MSSGDMEELQAQLEQAARDVADEHQKRTAAEYELAALRTRLKPAALAAVIIHSAMRQGAEGKNFNAHPCAEDLRAFVLGE